MTRASSSTPDDQDQLLLEFDRLPIELLTPDEIYARADESLLRTLFEDCRLEYKSCRIQAGSLAPYFSMWANTVPSGGLIVLGIREDEPLKYEIEGCASLSPARLNELELAGEVYCPDAICKVKRIPVRRDKDGGSDYVIVVRVQYHPTRVVRTNTGEVWVRKANRKKQLTTPEEIALLKAEKGEINFESEPCGLEYPGAFDESALNDFIAVVRAKKDWDASHSREDVLHLLHLGKLESGVFSPNIACALLFALDPRSILPGCRIRFLRFEGEDERTGEKWNAVKDEFIDGPIPALLAGADAMLRSQLRTFSRLGAGGKFFTTPEYPEFAWYEALVNACAHRSYGNGLRNAPIFVRMFDNRLVIESPGPFPPFVTADNVYTQHSPRNPFLMEAMFCLKYVKMAHEGTDRMRLLMQQNELPDPVFRQEDAGHSQVRVTLKNNIRQRRVWVDVDVSAILGAQIAQGLSEVEKRCINFCAEYGSIKVNDGVRLTTKDWQTIKNVLMGLVQKGILEYVTTGVERDPRSHFVLRGIRNVT